MIALQKSPSFAIDDVDSIDAQLRRMVIRRRIHTKEGHALRAFLCSVEIDRLLDRRIAATKGVRA